MPTIPKSNHFYNYIKEELIKYAKLQEKNKNYSYLF